MIVPLNHFYLVLDSETFAEVESSTFLQDEFAIFEKRTTVRNDITYTGIYYYGNNTYFEFFDGGRGGMGGPGDSALAFGMENPGGNRDLAERLSPTIPSKVNSINRTFEGDLVPWFSMLVPDSLDTGSPLRAWVMEYESEFLDSWNPVASAPNQGIQRAKVLQRYKDVLGQGTETRLYGDVSRIQLALPTESKKQLLGLCRGFGYACWVEGDHSHCSGPEIQLELIDPTRGKMGI